MVANFSQLEPLMRNGMRELGMNGVKYHLEYWSEEYDEEMEMESHPGFKTQDQ